MKNEYFIQENQVSCCNYTYKLYQPPHDKTNKTTVRPAKTQISLGIRPVWCLIRVFTVRMKKPWADAQADLNHRWAHSHFAGFVMRRLNKLYKKNEATIQESQRGFTYNQN